jgi:hypothetical protein
VKISFAPLAEVSVAHSYYPGACTDIEFVASRGTLELMRGGRVLVRDLGGSLRLLYEAESPGIPLSSLAGKILCFGLRLRNPCFDNVTKPVISDGTLAPYYANAVAPGVLDAPVGVSLVAGVYSHTPLLPQRPVALTLRSAAGSALDFQSLDQAAASYDLRRLPAGEYSVEESYGAGVVRQRRLFIDTELQAAGVWGLLTLRVDANFYASAPKLTLAFEARSETLNYYVVTRRLQDEEFDALKVTDAGFSAEGRPEITFERFDSPLPPSFLSESVLLPPAPEPDEPSARVAVFQSQTQVARRQRGLTKLRLARGATVLIEHLPLPGPERPNAELIVHLSKP